MSGVGDRGYNVIGGVVRFDGLYRGFVAYLNPNWLVRWQSAHFLLFLSRRSFCRRASIFFSADMLGVEIGGCEMIIWLVSVVLWC